jgi:3',5'-cyclic AMP phosphodiesterase CpdA
VNSSSSNDPAVVRRPRPATGLPLATVIQVSDLHFGEKFTNEEGWWRRNVSGRIPTYRGLFPHSFQRVVALSIRVKQVVSRRRQDNVPTVVAITGDLTRGGAPSEFVIANTYLRAELHATTTVGLGLGNKNRRIVRPGKVGLFVVPGNHDVWGRKSRDETNFSKYFQYKYPSECLIETGSRPIVLYGVDSTKTNDIENALARGRILPAELEAVLEAVSRNSSRMPVNIVCLHHPINDPQEGGISDVQKLHDREKISSDFLAAGVHLVIAGHVHRFYANALLEPHVPNHAVAGTASRQHSDCSFSIFDIYPEMVCLTVIEFSDPHCQFIPRKRTYLPII